MCCFSRTPYYGGFLRSPYHEVCNLRCDHSSCPAVIKTNEYWVRASYPRSSQTANPPTLQEPRQDEQILEDPENSEDPGDFKIQKSGKGRKSRKGRKSLKDAASSRRAARRTAAAKGSGSSSGSPCQGFFPTSPIVSAPFVSETTDGSSGTPEPRSASLRSTT